MKKKFWVQKNFGSNSFLAYKKKLGHQKFGSKKIFVLKIKGPKNIGFKRLVKIGPVINEIFLIWTNVAMKNVAWTNVIMTVGIC